MRCALVSYWHDIPALLAELQDYDKIFACERAAYALLKQGVKLERVIADFDSVPVEQFAVFDVETEQLPERKNETDTHVLLQYIVDTLPAAEVTLYNAFSDRLDHAFVLLSLFEVKNDLIIKTPATLMYRLGAGAYAVAARSTYQYISFIALTEVADLEINGLKYALAPTDVSAFFDLTISNEFTETGTGTLAFTSGQLLVMYAQDDVG